MTDAGNQTDAGPSQSSGPCPGAIPERNGLTAFDLDRLGFLGNTDFVVRFCNPLLPAQPSALIFYIEVTSHLGVPPSNFTQNTWVENGAGARTQGSWTWTGTDLAIGEHHAVGLLTGPSVESDGGALIGPDTAWIDLHLGGIGEEASSLTFRWGKGYLP